MTDGGQKHLVLILREFASNLATPTLIIDAEGRLVFFNEAAERVVGGSFAELGEIPLEDFAASVTPRTDEAEPFPPSRPFRSSRTRTSSSAWSRSSGSSRFAGCA